MKKIVFASIFALLMSASSLLAKDYVTKTVEIDDFNAITCNVPCEINYTPGAVKCVVTVPEKIENDLSFEVKDGELEISLKASKYIKAFKITVNLSSDSLEAVNLNGAVNFDAEEGIKARNFGASMNGASSLEIDGLKTKDVEVTVNGTGKVEIEKLKSNFVKVTVNGAGGCELEGQSDKADLTVNGVGRIDITDLKCDSINSSVNGIGSISRSK